MSSNRPRLTLKRTSLRPLTDARAATVVGGDDAKAVIVKLTAECGKTLSEACDTGDCVEWTYDGCTSLPP